MFTLKSEGEMTILLFRRICESMDGYCVMLTVCVIQERHDIALRMTLETTIASKKELWIAAAPPVNDSPERASTSEP